VARFYEMVLDGVAYRLTIVNDDDHLSSFNVSGALFYRRASVCIDHLDFASRF
jgi:hypothetical protein